ncbi:MAG TPA: type II toxin-antitoxin system VapC family toxin [Candidatus Limnocylindrales bacterium]|nr:type II toxin-antitoxin system VapC family toxin [Candidatus Limnocylindrales bacterium]
MIVIDASAAVELLLGRGPSGAIADRIGRAGESLRAPHLLDPEVCHALGSLSRRGQVTAERAAEAVEDLLEMPILRYPHAPLLARMWELRRNLSSFDAAYVALAEALDVPLVTTDAALARAPGHRARIELFAA